MTEIDVMACSVLQNIGVTEIDVMACSVLLALGNAIAMRARG